jgi:uncharacterized protein (TIGR02246 family)
MTTVVQDQEIAAIRAVIADADRLQSDAEGFTQLLTEDVALVNFGGRRVLGRSNVHRAMRQALDTPFAHVYTNNDVVDVRFLRPDAQWSAASSTSRMSGSRLRGTRMRQCRSAAVRRSCSLESGAAG